MLQRLLLKLGIIFIAGSLGAGVALANEGVLPPDSTAPGGSASQSNTHDVDISTTGDSTITVSSNSSQSQTVGSSVGPSGSSGSGTASSSGSSAAADQNSDTNASLLSLPASHNLENNSNLDHSSVGVGMSASGGSTGLKPEVGARFGLSSAAYQAVAHTVAALQAAAPLNLLPVATPETPRTPQNPTGLLSELRTLLTSSIIPALKPVAIASSVFMASIMMLSVQLTFLVLLLLASSLLLLNFYSARLRRSGYTDAARSDVGAALLFFVTPPKMSCTSVLVT